MPSNVIAHLLICALEYIYHFIVVQFLPYLWSNSQDPFFRKILYEILDEETLNGHINKEPFNFFITRFGWPRRDRSISFQWFTCCEPLRVVVSELSHQIMNLNFAFTINQFEKGFHHYGLVRPRQIAAFREIKTFLFPFVTRRWNIFQAETFSDLLNAVTPKIIDATFAQRLRGIRKQLLMFNPSTNCIRVYAQCITQRIQRN